ncbi:hypothetical protein L3X38_041527 [Prunus dulcis]|uniref:DUF4220 domain-containing protein n=1 Tax=Prunus dulcis TaxID=3755 RepID=A0AAD4YKP6_PRUDU|nr:hypothetical protein L3X38_041527 [Prunus dulcis]
MRIFSERLRMLWSLWEIRVMVPLSLILQAILLLIGNRRKYSTRNWLRFLWLAYLSADWVATVSLSLLSSNSSNDHATHSPDPNQIVTAFWAPFLLLHLAGPDTITAYSLEDNELWWRHLLVLLVQVSLAFYIFLQAWVGHTLNLLAIPIFIAGAIKFGERTWVLRSASSKHFRKAMFPPPDPGPNYARFMDEFCSNQKEGYVVKLGEETEAPTTGDYSSFTAPNVFPNAANLHHASIFLKVFKRLFADLILSIHDILNSRSFFLNRSCNEAFQVIEIELGFMYDLFYTKAVLVYSVHGVIFRLISFVCIVSVSAAFLVIDKKDFYKVNVTITYMLLAGAIILEVSAVILSLSSDWTKLWLNKKHNKFNLISFCCEDDPAHCSFLHNYKIPWIYKKFKKSLYKNSKEVPIELKELIFQQLIKKSRSAPKAESWKKFCACKGEWVLETDKCLDKLGWSIQDEFDQSILLWHIATDLCYYSDLEDNPNSDLAKKPNSLSSRSWKASKFLSEYLLYLLVMRPFMLPNGIGQIRFQDTCAEADEFFKQRKCKGDRKACKASPEVSTGVPAAESSEQRKPKEDGQKKACTALLGVSTEVPPAEVKGDRSKSVLFDACRLTKDLQSLETEKHWENQKKWELISHVWVEMLSYAACQCQWNHHARQLRRGGELLTHVWLLMAHLGITEQFQISRGYARASLIVQ